MPSFMLTAAFEPGFMPELPRRLWTVARRTPGARIGAHAGAAFAQVVAEALAHAD